MGTYATLLVFLALFVSLQHFLFLQSFLSQFGRKLVEWRAPERMGSALS